MNKKVGNIIYWAPRVLSLLFVAFISLFALDVFGEYKGLAVIVPLLMHLIPSFLLLIVIAIAWKYDLLGTIVFGLFAFWYTWTTATQGYWTWSLTLSAPALLVCVLFLLSWLKKRKENKSTI